MTSTSVQRPLRVHFDRKRGLVDEFLLTYAFWRGWNRKVEIRSPHLDRLWRQRIFIFHNIHNRKTVSLIIWKWSVDIKWVIDMNECLYVLRLFFVYSPAWFTGFKIFSRQCPFNFLQLGTNIKHKLNSGWGS